jgi:hypothetical protein
MEIPQPVDVNRLKAILGASKKIMNKVETGDFETGHIDARALTEEGVAELKAEGVTRPKSQMNHVGYTAESVKNSKLPEAIKKVMLENPIPQMVNPNHTFTIDDVSELADKPMGLPRIPKTSKKQIVESYNSNSNYITVSKEELNEMVSDMVNEKLLEFFVQNHNKRITEDAVKKTINMLIKEGKLKKTV